MAEKPLILAETNRYANWDWGGEFVGETWFEGTGLCDEGSFGNLVCNEYWYPGYLDKGKSRHIESYVMWTGDGPRWTRHLVLGWPESSDYGLGWTGPYDLGTGGQAVKDYNPDE